MGADLYLSSVSAKQFAKYEPLFEEWVSRRDALQAAGNLAEAEAAQQKVETYTTRCMRVVTFATATTIPICSGSLSRAGGA